MSDEAHRYVIVVRLDGAERFMLWESDETDRIVLDDAGFALTYPSALAARQAAEPPHAVSLDEPAAYNFDAVAAWCNSADVTVDCRALLNAWNLFTDLPQGESLFAAADARAIAVYDKLFFGCNLPAMTPPGEHYVPSWSASEIAALKRLLLLGLAELRARLR